MFCAVRGSSLPNSYLQKYAGWKEQYFFFPSCKEVIFDVHRNLWVGQWETSTPESFLFFSKFYCTDRVPKQGTLCPTAHCWIKLRRGPYWGSSLLCLGFALYHWIRNTGKNDELLWRLEFSVQVQARHFFWGHGHMDVSVNSWIRCQLVCQMKALWKEGESGVVTFEGLSVYLSEWQESGKRFVLVCTADARLWGSHTNFLLLATPDSWKKRHHIDLGSVCESDSFGELIKWQILGLMFWNPDVEIWLVTLEAEQAMATVLVYAVIGTNWETQKLKP